MKDLIVVTPSRGRPQNVERLWRAMEKTCRAGTELVIGLDQDDELRGQYLPGPSYVVRGGLERKVVAWINKLAMPRLGNCKAIGHFGDDCVPRTDGWDERILEALEKTPFAFGNDLSIERPAGSLCTHLFMRSATCRNLGYFGPPQIQHMWVDLAWMAWGGAAGMTYLDDVIIEHMHFLENKADMDWSYKQSRQLVDQDLAALWGYVRDRLNTDLEKLVPGHRHVGMAEFGVACDMRGTPIPVPVEFIARVNAELQKIRPR